MATYEEAIKALRAADSSGNAEDAKRLAKIAQKLKGDKGDFDFSSIEMVKNIPGSAGQYAKDLVTPILSPVDTASSLYNLARGAAEKLIPNEINGYDFGPDKHEAYADAVGKFFKDRYGSIDNLKRTVQEDPVGVLADISALFTAGGGAAGKIGTTKKTADAAKTMGAAVDPVNIVAKTGKYGVGKAVPKSTPRNLYQSAAKFRPSLGTKTKEKLTETALRKRVMPTSRGLSKIQDSIDALDSQIEGLIKNSEKSGKKIPTDELFKYIDDVKSELGNATNIDAASDLKRINKTLEEYQTHLKSLGRAELTPSEVQSLKRNIYKKINFDLSQGKSTYAQNEARKAVARGAKESLEKIDPSIKDINREMGDLIELQPELERSASRIENLNMVGLSAPMNVGAGSVIGDVPGAVIGTGVSIFEMPRVKSAAALGLEGARKMRLSDLFKDPVPGSAVRGAAVQSGRLKQSYEDEPLIRRLLQSR